MDFVELAKIENESERVNRTYDIFNEDARLNHSKAARVEFLTTVHYIEKYLKGGDKILDIGAGAGEYSLYFARKGYEVSALELADANIAAFKKKLTADDKIDLVQGNALDLSRYADKSFDMSDEDYTQYLRYHFYICEKPELLGMTNHLLFVGEKK